MPGVGTSACSDISAVHDCAEASELDVVGLSGLLLQSLLVTLDKLMMCRQTVSPAHIRSPDWASAVTDAGVNNFSCSSPSLEVHHESPYMFYFTFSQWVLKAKGAFRRL